MGFEDKVNKAVAGLGAQGIRNANYKIEGKVVTLTGIASDPGVKSRAMAWFNEQVETENTINMIRVETPNKPAAPSQASAPPPAGSPGASWSGTPAPTAPPVERADGPAPARIHVVEKGDTLSAISKKYYGKSSDYMRIFDANKDLLKDPDHIYPGQQLKIPN